MTKKIEDLKPAAFWHYFAELSKIPRCSKHEAAAVDWLARVAQERGVESVRDSVGNLLIRIPASSGCEAAPTVILQGHVDMVCEKNRDVEHDFSRDPIVPVIDGEWVRAEGTTLGADNGAGICLGLALLDAPEVIHGPLELLFTIDEETGLTGAAGIEPGFLSGEYLINLDSEEIGIFTVGCAGGRDSLITLPAPRSADSSGKLLNLSVSGLQGGHSGMDIAKNIGNSIKILAQLLLAAREHPDVGTFRLGAMSGGSMRNAIPREASALISVAPNRLAAFMKAIEATAGLIADELKGIDDQFQVKLDPAEETDSDAVADEDTSQRILWLLNALPHGVQAMSADIPILVETSNNVGVLEDLGNAYQITCASRTSNAPAMETLLARIRSTAHLAGGKVTHGQGYPGWKPNLQSNLLAKSLELHQRLFGEEAQVQAIHAGLECGLFTEKYPQLDIISYGPDIRAVHSPDERMHIASVDKVWKFTCALLEELAQSK